MILSERILKDLSWLNLINNQPKIPTTNIYSFKLLFKSTFSRSSRVVLLIRLYLYLSLSVFSFISYSLRWYLFLIYKIEIGRNVEIGGGLRLPHPINIIIGGNVKIGSMVTIGQNCTIGGNFGRKIGDNYYPKIMNWVILSTGVVVAGPIKISEDVIIGANSVITSNIEAHMVVSTSSKVWKKEKKEYITEQPVMNTKYFGYSSKTINQFK